MHNFLKILILPIAIITILVGFAPRVLAVAPLSVQFVPDPLFNKPNFLPGDETSGEVTVTNNSGTVQNILTETINVFDTDNFGQLLRLKIVENNGTLFDDFLADFFATAGEFPLGPISDGESKTFTFAISFVDSDDDSYQGKTLGFDVCVGFEGEQTRCGNTVVGDENGSSVGDNGMSSISGTNGSFGSSGGSGSQAHLVILNEQAINIPNITWTTNILSTSQVVYGLASGGPYNLVLTPPNFGYSLSTPENLTKVTHHSVFLPGLIPGETYVYRVISRASPPTISFERQFTVPLFAQVASNNLSDSRRSNFLGRNITEKNDNSGNGNSNINSNASVFQADIFPTVSAAEENPVTPGPKTFPDINPSYNLNNLNVAGLFGLDLADLLSPMTLIFLLIIIAFYLIWRIYSRRCRN